ncbi:hypothetical protein ACIRBX_19450 [Kitasatospora sp. NPDC096147]|uniref:hypothetical protein n=1 Tax=Kitasatospora sp. NPDC096147 TaxID=3364093 RepID=UPI0037FCD476
MHAARRTFALAALAVALLLGAAQQLTPVQAGHQHAVQAGGPSTKAPDVPGGDIEWP